MTVPAGLSHIYAQNRTWAARAAQRPQVAPVYTQAEQRDRRRTGLRVLLGADWSLASEVAAICEPLAASDRPKPLSYARCVDDLVGAVHAAVHDVISLLARADAERRTRHIGIDSRGRSIQALVDLAERPKLPTISDDELTAGTWSAVLVALVEPYSAPLGRLLGNARTSTVSDRVLAALAGVDAAAATLQRRLDRTIPARNPTSGPTESDRARAELAAMGIDTEETP